MIKPNVFSLTSTNVPGSTRSEWAVGTTYAIGDEVKDTRTVPNKLYKSITAGNVGNDPATDRINWFDEGATNQHKMIDNSVSTQTTNPDSIIVEFPVVRSDFISLFRLSGVSLRIEIIEDAITIFDKTFDLEVSDINDLFDYFFADFDFISDISSVIPIAYDATCRVTISNPSSIAKCGHLIVGRRTDIGLSLWGADIGRIDFSRKTTDSFGETYLVKGASAKTLNINCIIDTNRIDFLDRFFSSVSATPIVLQANNSDTEYESLLIFGFIKEFKINADVYSSKYTLEFQGLI